MHCRKVPLSNLSGQGFWEKAAQRVGDSGHQFSRESIDTSDAFSTTTEDLLAMSVEMDRNIKIKIDVDRSGVSILAGFSDALRSCGVSTLLIELEEAQFPDAEKVFLSNNYALDGGLTLLPATVRRDKKGRAQLFAIECSDRGNRSSSPIEASEPRTRARPDFS